MILTVLVTTIGTSIFVCVVKFGLWYLNSYRLLLRSNCFRGPRSFPLIGSAHLFTGDPADINRKLQQVIAQYQSPFRLWLGPRLYFVLHEPEHLKLILPNLNALEKDSFYDLVKPLLGNGLGIAPATSMGISLDATNNKDCPLFDKVESALKIIPMRMVKPWLQPDFIFKHTSVGQMFYKNVAYIHGFARNGLNSAKRELQKEIKTECQPRKYLVRQLLTLAEDNCKFTDKEVLDHVLATIGGGYDTTVNLLSEAILMLARYPNMQDKVYAEVREIIGESDGADITLQNIHRMQYMDRVLKETLRFFPGVPTVLRYLSKEINIGKYTLPAGSSVMINMIATHRNEKYWPRSLEFNPDRFLPGHPLRPRHPYAYTPFSMGTRNCIGMKYGMITAKILLATLVSRYIVKTRISQEPADLEINIGVTLTMKNPIMVSIERRVPESS